MSRQFEGFVVVVTGASTGLGRAIAVEVASQGARTVLINYANNRADAEETARQVEALGAAAVIFQGDVADDADCRRIAAAAAPFGRIDALFNNAGTTRFAAHGDMEAVPRRTFWICMPSMLSAPSRWYGPAETCSKPRPSPALS
jgi:NAD(P)-dependent dehydrogenase (short-subunit alcohol dehydrogenase family)